MAHPKKKKVQRSTVVNAKGNVQLHTVVNSASWMNDLPMDILYQQEQFLGKLLEEKMPLWLAPLFMRFAEHLYQPSRHEVRIYHNLRTRGHRWWFLSLHGLGCMDMLKVINVDLVNTNGEMPPKHEDAVVYDPDGPSEPFSEEIAKWFRTAGPSIPGKGQWYTFEPGVRRLLAALYYTGVEMWLEQSDVAGAFTVCMYHDRSLVRMDFQSQAGQVWGSY